MPEQLPEICLDLEMKLWKASLSWRLRRGPLTCLCDTVLSWLSVPHVRRTGRIHSVKHLGMCLPPSIVESTFRNQKLTTCLNHAWNNLIFLASWEFQKTNKAFKKSRSNKTFHSALMIHFTWVIWRLLLQESERIIWGERGQSDRGLWKCAQRREACYLYATAHWVGCPPTAWESPFAALLHHINLGSSFLPSGWVPQAPICRALFAWNLFFRVPLRRL